LVVKLLIDAGADVNAPRLPRRYTSNPSHDKSSRHRDKDRDREREPRMPVGVSGSTPLHFAAANGHEAVVLTLLRHGARTDKLDKNGAVPEKVARDSGWMRVADILRGWANDRDRDLREREMRPRLSGDADGPGSMSKRLRVKRSIEGLLRHSSSQQFAPAPPSPTVSDRAYASQQEISSSPKPFGEYTFYPTSSNINLASESRRPSLPHIHEHCHNAPHPVHARKSRRPRSAGTDAEDNPVQSTGRRLGTKYSLLNMLRKSTDTPPEDSPLTRPPLPGSASASPSPRVAPLPGTSPDSSTNFHDSPYEHQPSAVELHHALSRERLHLRNRSGSGSSRPGPGILLGHGRSASGGQSQSSLHHYAQPQPPPSSSYQSSSPLANPARLRFDSTSTNNSAVSLVPGKRPGMGLGLRASSSTNSLGLHARRGSSTERHVPDSAPPGVSSFEKRHGMHISEEFLGEDEDEDEYEYGEPIDPVTETRRIRARFNMRLRGRSIDSSTSSLSPILSPGAMPNAGGTPSRELEGKEFPFSIANPPPEASPDVDGSPRLVVPPSVTGMDAEKDNRMRGGSISSMSTSTSASAVVTTPAPATRLPLPVPAPRKFSLESDTTSVGPISDASPSPDGKDSAVDVILCGKRNGPRPSFSSVVSQSSTPSLGSGIAGHHGRRPSHPRAAALGIDMSEISSRAEAEALVMRAEQSILELNLEANDADGAGAVPDTEGPGKEWGMTPLSARLAAYGESLAIQRMMKEEEEHQLQQDLEKSKEETDGQSTEMAEQSTVMVERQGSLDTKTSPGRKKNRAPKMKRPHTSGATDQGRDNSGCQFVVRLTYISLTLPVSAWPSAEDESPSTTTGTRVRHLPFRSVSYNVGAGRSPSDNGEQMSLEEPPDTANTGITIVETCPTPIQTPIEPSGFRQAQGSRAASFGRTQSNTHHPISKALPPARPLTPEAYLDYSDEGSTIGVPLSRVSTAPLPSNTPGVNEVGGFFPSMGSTSSSRRDVGQAKQYASNNKLAKMGLPGQAVTGAPPQAKPKFGLKGLVRSLKGKS
jgi:hypothetical protein